MKTLTEFFGKNLKAAQDQIPAWTTELTKSINETMTAEGKSEIEIAAGLPVVLKSQLEAKMGEFCKVEGDKLALLLSAMESVKGKKGNLKRVVVAQLSEGEKAPAGAFEADGKVFLLEFFPEPTRAHTGGGFRDNRDGDRRDGRGKGKPGRGGDGKGRRDSGRGPRRSDTPPAPTGVVIQVKAPGESTGISIGSGTGAPPAPRPRREPREPRADGKSFEVRRAERAEAFKKKIEEAAAKEVPYVPGQNRIGLKAATAPTAPQVTATEATPVVTETAQASE